MEITVKTLEVLQKVKGKNEHKHKFGIEFDGCEYIVLAWKDIINTPIVYDTRFDAMLCIHNWYVAKGVGYAYEKKTDKTMHSTICKFANVFTYDDRTIDHKNWYKLDNRLANLRMATQAEQNANRTTRSDKKPPHQCLIEAGITELPRHIRWDNSETKFVIEKHPLLLIEVQQGIRQKPQISGTKQNRLTILQKYQDIVIKLNALDMRLNDKTMEQFQQEREKLKFEYEAIVSFVKQLQLY
jgi:hypothetical protein